MLGTSVSYIQNDNDSIQRTALNSGGNIETYNHYNHSHQPHTQNHELVNQRPTVYAGIMTNGRSRSECIVRTMLNWRNGLNMGNKKLGMDAECIKQCQLVSSYSGFEDDSNTRWSLRGFGDFGAPVFKE